MGGFSPEPPPDTLGYAWNRPLLITVVFIICVIFLLLGYFNFLQRRCFLFYGPPFRDGSLTRLLNMNNQADDPSLDVQSRGLDFAIVHSLPAVQFRKPDSEAGQSSADCAVCLGEFEDGEWLRVLPNCAHIFHVSCVDTWFRAHSTCPLCRSDVLHDFDKDSRSHSVYSLMESLVREEAYTERPHSYNVLGSDLIRNSAIWCRPTNFVVVSESDSSVSTVSLSSPVVTNDHQTSGCLQKQDLNLQEGSSSRDGYSSNQDIE